MNFIDPTARIGAGTQVWHFAVVLADVVIGNCCSIGAGAEVGRGSVLGDETRLSHGVFLPSNSRIGCKVFLGPNVTFTDDRYPRAQNPHYHAEPPVVEDFAAIGAGAVILPGIRIGHHALIAAGAIVAHDVEPYGVVVGQAALPILPLMAKHLRRLTEAVS